jgi:hypothetical protein
MQVNLDNNRNTYSSFSSFSNQDNLVGLTVLFRHRQNTNAAHDRIGKYAIVVLKEKRKKEGSGSLGRVLILTIY